MARAHCLFLLCCAYAQAARHSEADDGQLGADSGMFSKDRICGSDMIPSSLKEGSDVESIRGIQWNAIFKTAQAFLDNKDNDMAELRKDIEDLEKEIADLVAQREKNQVPAMTDKKIKSLISEAVEGEYKEVYRAQEKLCWLGSMEPNKKANVAFGEALFPLLENTRTDITTVQKACLDLLIKGDAYVNMCDELCNMIGKTTAEMSRKSNRVKALTSLTERINKLQVVIDEKRGDLTGFEAEARDCKLDKQALEVHKKDLQGLSKNIKDEKVKLFMAWNSMHAAEEELTDLTAENKALRENTEELDKLLAGADDEKTKIKDNLKKLEQDEMKLDNDLDVETRQANDIDAVVKSTGEAIEVVSEFKLTLERMILSWNEYYMKSIVEPIQKAGASFSSNSEELQVLKAQTSETAKTLSEFCGTKKTKTVLKGVAKLPELPLICDGQIDDWTTMVSHVDEVVTKMRTKQVQDLKDLEGELSLVAKENAYSGPEREGILAEVQGVWPSGTYFADTLFTSTYLRGWKALHGGGDPKELDGRWMRLCDALQKQFADALAKQKEAEEALEKTRGDFDNLLAEMDKIKANLEDAEKNHAMAKANADQAKEKLADMLAKEEKMQDNLADLAKKHEKSLEALKQAETTYVGEHAAAVK